MKFYLPCLLAAAVLALGGCKKADSQNSGKKPDNVVQTYLDAKAKRDYKAMWACYAPAVQRNYGNFDAFKAEQEKTYQTLGESGWKAMIDQTRENNKIPTVEIDGKHYINEK